MMKMKKMSMMKRRRVKLPLTTRKKKKKKKQKKRHENQQSTTCIQPPLDYPWYLCRTGGKSGYICCNTSPEKYKGFTTSFPDDIDVRCVFNCCYGWLIFWDSNKIFSLWNPVISKLITLPQIEWTKSHSVSGAVLSSPGNRTDELDPNCMIMIFIEDIDSEDYDRLKPSLITYCLLGEKLWNSIFYDGEFTGFTFKPAILNGIVYAEGGVRNSGDNRLFGIDSVSSSTGRIVVTKYGILPRVSEHPDVTAYLVESCGELFYIIITWSCSCGQMVSDCYQLLSDTVQRLSDLDAYKLDQVSMRFNKVSEVGDRVFFFEGSSYILSCVVSEENKGGFLYYICPGTHRSLYSYNFAENSVSTSFWYLPMPYNKRRLRFSPDRESSDKPLLYLPDRRLIDEPDFQLNLVETRLLLLPCELIKFISTFLNPVDYLSFRSVSRICRLLLPTIGWREAPINLADAPPLSPWLVSSCNGSGIYKFIDSRLGGKYLMETPKSLVNMKIIDSNHGWLLLTSSSYKTFFFCNPFTSEIIKLARLHGSPYVRYPNIRFLTSPTSSNCLVVAIGVDFEEIEINIFETLTDEWERYFFEFDIAKLYLGLSYCPVFHHGDIYVLGNNGNLGVFKFEDDEPISWEVLEITKEPCSFYNQNFLLEDYGELYAVSMNEVGRRVNVFVLNETTMTWEAVDNFGNFTLYLSRTTSFFTPAKSHWMNNIIVYFSVETGKYHTVANRDTKAVEYQNTRELILPGWIEPSWS